MSLDYKQLLLDCGLEEDWQEANKSRIETFLDRIYVREQADIDHAMEFMHYTFDTSMAGVRMCLNIFMREAMDWVLARDENECVIQYGRPTMATLCQACHVAENRINAERGLSADGKKAFYCRGTSIVYTEIVMGCIFDKTNWLIELGEDLGQTAGKGHCSEYQIWEGGIVKGIFPKPDCEITCGIFCDQAPEVECMLADEFGYDIVCTDMPEDHQWDTWPNIDPRSTQYDAANNDAMYDYLAEHYGFRVTEEDLDNGAIQANRVVSNHFAIVDLMNKADPVPVSQADVCLPFYLFVCGTVYFDDAMAAIKQFQKDTRKRIREGYGVTPKGAPRVYQTFRPVADFRIYKVMEELGIATPCAWFDIFPPEVFNSDFTSERPCEQMYEIIYRFCGLGDHFGSSLKSWKWVLENIHADGIILFMTMFCRPDALPVTMARDYLQKEMDNIPAIIVELDSFDSRNYTPGQYRTRLESFAEILKMRKALKPAETAAEA